MCKNYYGWMCLKIVIKLWQICKHHSLPLKFLSVEELWVPVVVSARCDNFSLECVISNDLDISGILVTDWVDVVECWIDDAVETEQTSISALVSLLCAKEVGNCVLPGVVLEDSFYKNIKINQSLLFINVSFIPYRYLNPLKYFYL